MSLRPARIIPCGFCVSNLSQKINQENCAVGTCFYSTYVHNALNTMKAPHMEIETMNILDKLNSGTLHATERAKRPDCVDNKGNVHRSQERAQFVNWLNEKAETLGMDIANWPNSDRAQYEARYVASH